MKKYFISRFILSNSSFTLSLSNKSLKNNIIEYSLYHPLFLTKMFSVSIAVPSSCFNPNVFTILLSVNKDEIKYATASLKANLISKILLTLL